MRPYLACIVIAFLLISTPSKGAGVKSFRQRVSDLLAQRAVKNQMQRETRAKLRRVKRKERVISSELRVTQQKLEQTNHELNKVARRLGATEVKLSRSRKQLRLVQSRLTHHNRALGYRLASIYRNGTLTYLEILFNATDFSELVKRTYLFRKVVEYDISLLNQIKEERQQVEVKKQELEGQRQEIVGLREQVSSKKETIQGQKKKQAKLLGRIQNERAAYEQYLAELEEDSRQIESMIRRLSGVRRRSGHAMAPWKGGFVRPVSGRITCSFGWRIHPIHHIRSFHTGVDIGAHYGTPIHAAAGGVVYYAGWMRAYGRTIVIEHGGGLETVYGHCSSVSVHTGQTITQGERIGAVGSTGLSTGPHLHFEVRRFGQPVNPMGVH